ncbi:MAG TPA: 3-ketoacyl-CoA thiolase [Parachlamydiaceae bacterium]|nr:3-ketoacyl-CoA thiolase [Parachlamydiaceae bacterium]
MKHFKKAVYIAAGYNTLYFGPGRKEFNPSLSMPSFESYLEETAKGTMAEVKNADFDEGLIGSFMAAKFLNQANLPGFLPFMVPSLNGKPCTGIEGACGTGGRVLGIGIRSILSDFSDSVFAAGFEVQNSVKSVYGADILAGAAYYNKERKTGFAFFFPGIFAERTGAYYKQYGEEKTRRAMAKWYELAILNARKNKKAQEFHNKTENLFETALIKPDPKSFIPYLNLYNCSKVTDGASSLLVLSEEGLKKCGIDKKDAVEIVGIGEAETDITKAPADLTVLSTTETAVKKALSMAGISLDEIGILEIHDCFAITAILSLEAIGFAKKGEGTDFILEGHTAKEGKIGVNLSGGLTAFGHPTGASGVRQMVDLLHQLTGKAENQLMLKKPYGMMVSMGGNDKTVTCLIVKAASYTGSC